MEYSYDDAMAADVARIITEDDTFKDLRKLKLAVLYCDRDKKLNGRSVFADVKKPNDLYSFLSGYDFVITFYEKVQHMSSKAVDVLIRHELMHIGVESRGGNVRKFCRPQDVQDFREIIDKYGVDWPLMGDKK